MRSGKYQCVPVFGSIKLPQTTPNYLKPPQTTICILKYVQYRSIYTYIVYVYTYKIHILMYFGAYTGLFAHLYWCSLFLNLWLNLRNCIMIVCVRPVALAQG